MKTARLALAALNEAPHWQARASLRRDWLASGLHQGRLLPDLIRERVSQHPSTPIVFGSRERPSVITAGELLTESYGIARGLRALGLREGDVIVVQVPNWKEAALVLLASLHLGLVFVPMLHTLGPAEIEYVLRRTGATVFVVPDKWKKIDYAARIAALGNLPDLKHVLVIGDGPMPRPVKRWSELDLSDAAPLPSLTATPDDAWLIIFTSGTTAAPKGAIHTHNSFATEVENFPLVRSPTGRGFFNPFPGGHAAGVIVMLSPLLLADACIMMDAFEEDLAVELIKQHRPDRATGVPYILSIYLKHQNELFVDGLLQIVTGAASVPPALIDGCEQAGWPGTRTYGSTEHLTICGSFPHQPRAKRATTDGQLLAGVQVRLMDDDNRIVPSGTPGEIVSMGPDLFKGYLDDEHNQAAFDSDGWFHTGDIGVMDQDGYLSIVDRKKDIIIRGGENISSKEVEDVMMRHAAVGEVAAVAWPDDMLGERVALFVRLKADSQLSLDDIKAHFAAEGLARHKTPERLIVIDEFPRNATGKILKTELRKQVTALAKNEVA